MRALIPLLVLGCTDKEQPPVDSDSGTRGQQGGSTSRASRLATASQATNRPSERALTERGVAPQHEAEPGAKGRVVSGDGEGAAGPGRG